METLKRNVIYLSADEIVERNREIILKTGGFKKAAGKVINSNSLEYLIEIMRGELIGYQPYPSLSKKAAAYAYYIIHDHVFYDGNKRTGISCAILFLNLNGYQIDTTDDEIVELAISITNNLMNIDEIAKWFEDRLEYLEILFLLVSNPLYNYNISS